MYRIMKTVNKYTKGIKQMSNFKISKNTLNREILREIQKKRNPSYTKLIDIDRIIHAKIARDYTPVFKTNLYKIHGGEYCELLQIIERYVVLEVDTSI